MTRNEKSLQALFSGFYDPYRDPYEDDYMIPKFYNVITKDGKIVEEHLTYDCAYEIFNTNPGHYDIVEEITNSRRPIKSSYNLLTEQDKEYLSKCENHDDVENYIHDTLEYDFGPVSEMEDTDKWENQIFDYYNNVIQSSRRPIKSGYDILNVGDKTPAGNLIFYLVNDGKRMPIMTEDYAIRKGGYDKDYLYEGSKNGEFVRFDGFDRIINRLAKGCGITEYIDQIEYSIKGNKVEFTVYPTEQGIHLLNNGWWDDYSVRWELSAEEQIPLYDGDEIVAMTVTLTILGL